MRPDDVKHLDREQLVTELEARGFACYEHECDAALRTALRLQLRLEQREADRAIPPHEPKPWHPQQR